MATQFGFHAVIAYTGPSGDIALQLLANPLAFLEEITARHGKVVGMVLGGERVALVADSQAAEQALITQSSSMAKVAPQ